MTVILNLAWAAALLPVVGIALSLLPESPRRAAQVGTAFTGAALAVAAVVLVFRLTHSLPPYVNTETFLDQLSNTGSAGPQPTSGELLVLWGIRVDPLSVAFMAAVLAVSLAVQLHALTALRGDAGVRRFFWASELLTFGLLTVVVSPNLFQMLIGWGLSSAGVWVLAVHHWQRRTGAVAAARAFSLLHVGDVVLLLGVAVTYAKFGLAVSEQPSPQGQTTADPFSFSTLPAAWHLGHVGGVQGVGARSLVILAVLLLVAATVRAALGPLHVWLMGTLDAPFSGLALVGLASLLPAAFLLARVYPLLLEAPHMLLATALVGVASALVAAVLALLQRDLLRLGMFVVTAEAGLAMAAFGAGGYSPALFVVFTETFLTGAYFLAAGNLCRGYRTRDIAEIGDARRRMPRTALVLGGWGLGVAGLSLNTYSVLAAVLRNATPLGRHLDAAAVVVLALGVVVAAFVTALAAARVHAVIAGGSVPRRRGFDVSRLREVTRRLALPATLLLGAAVAATLVGIPGVSSFRAGGVRVPGLTFSHFIFYGAVRQQLAFDPLALLIAAAAGAAGVAGAQALFGARGIAAAPRLRARLDGIAARLARPTFSERAATRVPPAFSAAGRVLDGYDREVVVTAWAAMGDALESRWTPPEPLLRLRGATGLAAAGGVLAVLLAAAVLAATGHFPVTIR